jgi:pyridoxal phosphate enzyme (YggS family)
MQESELRDRLSERIAQVEGRIEEACRRAGRARRDVTLVAVTKTVTPPLAALLPESGITELGESRPQELWHKAALLPQTVHWHLVGHLQRNKIERTLPLVQMIHSVDSLRLLQALEAEAAKQWRSVPALIEVNASGEQSKHGFTPEETAELAARVAGLKWVKMQGLMTMARYEDEPHRCRPTFRLVRELRDRLQATLPAEVRLEHLSMGMTNDFEVAIEEGATLVRIGTALFEGLANLP